MTRRRLIIGPLLAIVAAVAVTTACGSSHQSSQDPGGQPGTRSAVIQFPRGFRNVAVTCYGTTGVYVTSRGTTSDNPSSVAVLADDPHCRR